MFQGPVITTGCELDVQGVPADTVRSTQLFAPKISSSITDNPEGALSLEDLVLGKASFSLPIEGSADRMELPKSVQQEFREGSCDQQKMRAVGYQADVVPKSIEEKIQEDISVDFASSLRKSLTHPSINQPHRGNERRKPGRPIMHRGNPDDPGLTEKERRRLKRRIANRESARRVRNRRQDEMEDMQIKASATTLLAPCLDVK